MEKKVVLSSTAKQKLEGLLVYLNQEWSEKVKQEFIEKLDAKRTMKSLSLKRVKNQKQLWTSNQPSTQL